MAGKFNSREVETLSLAAAPIPLPGDPIQPPGAGIPAGVGIIAFDSVKGTLTLSYRDQSAADATAVLARSETTVLATNVLGGVQVTAVGPQVLVGAVYLPDGVVDPASDSVLSLFDGQGLGLSTMTVTVRSLTSLTVVANFSISVTAPGDNQAVVSVDQPGPTLAGWYEVRASLSSVTAQGLIGGLRLLISPNT